MVFFNIFLRLEALQILRNASIKDSAYLLCNAITIAVRENHAITFISDFSIK